MHGFNIFYQRLVIYPDRVVAFHRNASHTWFFRYYKNIIVRRASLLNVPATISFVFKNNSVDKNKICFNSGAYMYKPANTFAEEFHSELMEAFNAYVQSHNEYNDEGKAIRGYSAKAPSSSPGQTKPISNLSDCVRELEKYLHINVFQQNIKLNIEQIQRFKKRHQFIKEILLQKFSQDEISYKKFVHVLSGVEQVIFINVRDITNKITAFDFGEYDQLNRLKWNCDEMAREKNTIFQDYISFVDEATRTNEEILLKLDKLQLKILQFSRAQDRDAMTMEAIAELDTLIKHADLYK
jgi:hypothetical protein